MSVRAFILSIALLSSLTACQTHPEETGPWEATSVPAAAQNVNQNIIFDSSVAADNQPAIAALLEQAPSQNGAQSRSYTSISGKPCLWLQAEKKSWIACREEKTGAWHVESALMNSDTAFGGAP